MKLHRSYPYGLDIPETTHPALVELALYDNPDWRNVCDAKLTPEEHMMNAIRVLFPPSTFDLNAFSKRIIEEWCNTNALTIWGPSAVVKSGTIGMVMLMDLLVSPETTLTRVVTNPLEEHKNRCYGSFMKWYQNLPREWQQWKFREHPSMGMPTVKDDQAAGVVCFSNKPGDSWEDLKRKLGAHRERNRVIGDEVQGCSEMVLKIRVNMGASGHYKEAFLGNPDSWFNPLGKHSLPKHYDRSWVEKEEPDRWETKNKVGKVEGVCIVLDGRKSPSLKEPERFPYMLQPEHVANIKEQYGDESPLVWTYIVGRIPPGGMKHVIMNEADLLRFGAARDVVWKESPLEIVAGDFAPQGKDNNALRRVQIGIELETGRMVLHSKEVVYCEINVRKPDKSLQIAKQVAGWLGKWGVGIEKFVGDSTGNQGPLLDTIEREMGEYGAGRIDTSGGASEHPIGHGQTAKERYKNRASEVAMSVERLLRQGQISGLDDRTMSQISTRNIVHADGRIEVEKKEDWRNRNGHSPDEFDTLALACTFAIERGFIKVGDGSARALASGTADKWADLRRKLDQRARGRRGQRARRNAQLTRQYFSR